MSQYGDLFDEDTQTLYEDDSTRCKHGTYIGTPGGPDFMCGRCEMGDDEPEHICEGENCSPCPRCYKATGKEDVCAYTCEHGV